VRAKCKSGRTVVVIGSDVRTATVIVYTDATKNFGIPVQLRLASSRFISAKTWNASSHHSPWTFISLPYRHRETAVANPSENEKRVPRENARRVSGDPRMRSKKHVDRFSTRRSRTRATPTSVNWRVYVRRRNDISSSGGKTTRSVRTLRRLNIFAK